MVATHCHYLPEVLNFENEFLGVLDKTGVEKAVILGNAPGAKPMNDYVIKFVKRAPDRIIGVCYLDPRERGAADALSDFVEKQGMRGLKLIAGIGFYPNDRKLYPVYETARDLGIPIMMHCCSVSPYPHLRQVYSQPIFIDDVARNLPGLNIIIVHAGQYFIDQTLAVGNLKNVFVETSSMGDMTLFDQNIARLMARFKSERVMFGGPDHAHKNMQNTIEQMLSALEKADALPREIELVMSENAKRVFGL